MATPMPTRKRKQMIYRLNKFFEAEGKILTEQEYMAHGRVPFRIGVIKKYLRSWPSMVAYIKTKYPYWKEETVKKEPVKESKPLEAFYSSSKKVGNDKDEDE